MDLYLIQHGQARSTERDPQRPLSDDGRATVIKMADHLTAHVECLGESRLTKVRHSGKLRAQQTAEIYAQALCPNVTPAASRGMNPNDDPRTICEELASRRDQEGALLLVGHLPHLTGLAGLLLTEDAEKTPIRFVNAAALKICSAKDGWTVEWYITPACVR